MTGVRNVVGDWSDVVQCLGGVASDPYCLQDAVLEVCHFGFFSGCARHEDDGAIAEVAWQTVMAPAVYAETFRREGKGGRILVCIRAAIVQMGQGERLSGHRDTCNYQRIRVRCCRA